MPVSYTHLDVYKRQERDRAGSGHLRADRDESGPAGGGGGGARLAEIADDHGHRRIEGLDGGDIALVQGWIIGRLDDGARDDVERLSLIHI